MTDASWTPPEAAGDDANWTPPEAAAPAPAAPSSAPMSNTTDPSLGTLDAMQHYIRSAVAPLGGGLTYLGTLAATGGDTGAAAAVKQQTEETISGQPMTKSGQAIVNTVNAAAAPAIKRTQDALQSFADKTYETGIPVAPGVYVGAHTALAGAFGATLPQALMAVATGGRAAEAAGGVFEGAEIPKPTVAPVEGAPQAAVAAPKTAGPVTGADLLAEPDPLGLHEHAAVTAVTPPGTQGGPTAGLGSTAAGAAQRGGPKFEAPNPADPAEAMYEDQVRRDMAAAAANPNGARPPLRQGAEDPAQHIFDAQVREDTARSTPLNQPPLGSTAFGASQRGGPKFTPTQGTGIDTAGQVVEYQAPKDEGVQSGALPAVKQTQRAATIGALNDLSGGALPEVRTSAITGDTKETGVDWAHAKVTDPAGARMTGVIANEQNAVRSASANIQRSTGDPQEGVDRDALLGRGTQLNNLFSAVQDHFDKGSAALYQDANGKASATPLTNIDRVKTVLSDPANFPGVEGKALHEDLISRGQQLGFLPKGANAAPQDALTARMQSAGLTPPSNTSTPTVQHGEQWRQFTGDLWSSKTARTIQKFRDAMDEDAGSASGNNLYTAARAMNTQRRTIFEPDVMQKLAAPKDRAGVEGLDVADIPDHIAEQGEGQFNHVVNVIKSAAHLKSTDHDFPTLAANAMNALRGHMAAKLHDAGVSKIQGGWDPKSYYNKVNAYSLKMPMLFKPQEIENVRTVNRAGNALKMDKTYKGAEVEAQNIGIVGKGRQALGKGVRGLADLGSHSVLGVAGPVVTEVSGLGHGIQKIVGGDPAKAFQVKRLRDVESRIQKVGTSPQVPPVTPKPGPRGPQQRGGPAVAKITGHDDQARRSLERMAGFERKGETPVAGFHGSQRAGLTGFNDPDQAGSGIGVAARGAGLYVAGDEPGAKIYAGKNGTTYKVSAPGLNHSDLLHWDKPISENPTAAKVFAAHGIKGNLTGGEAYEQLSEKLVPPPPGRPAKGEGHTAASKILNAHGVPGISYDASGKYSQGGSTARNAVIFDPSKVKVEGGQTLGQQIGGAKQRGGPKYTPPKEDEGSLTFRHFSPNLTADKVTLDPKYNGTGIKGAEWKRQQNEKAPQVISAYAADHPTHQVEPGLRGTTEYAVNVPKSKMYDLSADPKGYLKSGPGAFTAAEKKIKAAGYTGYHLPDAEGIHKGQARFFKSVEGSRVGAAPPLSGMPQEAKIGKFTHKFGPNETARGAATEYAKSAGIDNPPVTNFRYISRPKGEAIAKAYADMKDDPTNPAVKASYKALADETRAQFDAIKKTGLKVEFIKPGQDDPYAASPRLANIDVNRNNHLWVYPTESGFGSLSEAQKQHPLLQDSGRVIDGKKVTNNDLFRVVHDYFGHIAEGNGFRANGEYNAWRIHSRLYSPEAQGALASETLGQNAWVNFGPHGAENAKASGAKTTYADQKAGLMDPKVYGGTKGSLAPEHNVGSPEDVPSMAAAAKQQYARLAPRDQSAVDLIAAQLHESDAAGGKTFQHLMAKGKWTEAQAQQIKVAAQAKYWGDLENKERGIEPDADEAHPVLGHLLPEERAQLRTDTTKRLTDAFDALPHTAEYAAAALAGQAKKGWYENSAKTIANVFGPDAPRFSALLASMSPQTSVQMNFHNALRTFVNWDKAGRPQDPKVITDIARKSVLRQENGTGLLHAWVPNMIRSLTTDAPDKLTLSGPKVHSFYGNLNDKVNEVTNDAWMANFAKVDAGKLAGGINKAGTAPGKSPTYLAMSAKVRAAAAMISKATGETWTPREVQETVWSWAKTAFEHANKTGKTIPDLVKNGEITDDLIKSTPDFHQLFSSPEHAGFLAGSRFAKDAGEVPGAQGAGAESKNSGQARPTLGGIIKDHLAEASRRLESVRQGRKVTADDEDVPF